MKVVHNATSPNGFVDEADFTPRPSLFTRLSNFLQGIFGKPAAAPEPLNMANEKPLLKDNYGNVLFFPFKVIIRGKTSEQVVKVEAIDAPHAQESVLLDYASKLNPKAEQRKVTKKDAEGKPVEWQWVCYYNTGRNSIVKFEVNAKNKEAAVNQCNIAFLKTLRVRTELL